MGLAHFLGLLIGVQNPANMGVLGQDDQVQKPGKEFGHKTAFLDGLEQLRFPPRLDWGERQSLKLFARVLSHSQWGYRFPLDDPKSCCLTAVPQPSICCLLFLYSVLVTVSESRYFCGSAAI